MPLSLFLPPLFIAALFLYLPFISPDQFFAMPVPPEWRSGPQARRIRYVYGAVVLLLAASSAILCVRAASDHHIVYSVAIAEPLALLAAWTWGWNRTLPARLPHPVLRSAALHSTAGPGPILALTLASLLPLAVAAGYLAAHYSAIPPNVPIHYTAEGTPNHIVARSFLAVFGPFLLGGTLILFLAGLLHAVSRRSAGFPGSSRYLSLTRTIFLAATWFAALQLSLVSLLPVLRHPASLSSRITDLSSGSFLLLILATFAYLRQWPALTAAQATTAEEHWKGGLWYYNPHDAALFVPKRLGIGYTLNMARPESWLLMAATLILVLVPLALKHL